MKNSFLDSFSVIITSHLIETEANFSKDSGILKHSLTLELIPNSNTSSSDFKKRKMDFLSFLGIESEEMLTYEMAYGLGFNFLNNTHQMFKVVCLDKYDERLSEANSFLSEIGSELKKLEEDHSEYEKLFLKFFMKGYLPKIYFEYLKRTHGKRGA